MSLIIYGRLLRVGRVEPGSGRAHALGQCSLASWPPGQPSLPLSSLCSSPVNRVRMNKKTSSLAAARKKAFSGRNSSCIPTLSSLVHICVEQAIFHADILHLVKCQQIRRDVALTHSLPFRASVWCGGNFQSNFRYSTALFFPPKQNRMKCFRVNIISTEHLIEKCC